MMHLVTGKSHFENWGDEFNFKPLLQKISLENFVFQDFFASLECGDKILLESSKQDEKNRFSIIGIRPYERIYVCGDEKNKMETLRAKISEWKAPLLDDLAPLPFYGGLLGFLSYEASRFLSPMKFQNLKRKEGSFPDLVFGFYSEVFVFDHQKEELYLCSSARDFEDASKGILRLEGDLNRYFEMRKEKPSGEIVSEFLGSNFEYEEYLKAIEQCRDYIERGHSYQINLAQELKVKTQKSPWQVYKDLTQINPVSFGAFFRVGDFEVVCGSPELLIRKRGRKLSARPIAGTRKRGSEEQNECFRRELREDSKEQAEHAMLVDLMRNDLGRVSEAGSVKVDSYADLVEYTHVMHLESDLSSLVCDEVHPLDVLAAVFPGGTVTGVPKLRTMEIIDELEQTERNIYTGTIGYISFTGDMDFNIVIRSLLFKNNEASFHVGGGLTYDCVAEREYKETMNKARSQLVALEV